MKDTRPARPEGTRDDIEGTLWTNHELVEVGEWEGDPGFASVERVDDDEVAIHLGQDDGSSAAALSLYVSRANAALLALQLADVATRP